MFQPQYLDCPIADLCQTFPGSLLTGPDFTRARELLLALQAFAGTKYLPHATPKSPAGKPARTPDLFANLWFIQTSYAYYVASHDEPTWQNTLLPFAKHVAQGVISDVFQSTHMDDGGLLGAGKAKARPNSPFPALQLNILWYNAISIISQEYRRLNNHAADHFDRLAARFRRSFLKIYWCDAHSCLCDPADSVHTSSSPRFDPYQVLAVILPFTAVPYTKQRALVEFLRDRVRTPLGLTVPPHWTPSTSAAPLLSTLALVWLADGRLKTFEPRARAAADAREWLTELHDRMGAFATPLPQFFDPATLAPVPANAHNHRPTLTELQRVWASLEQRSTPSPPTIPTRPTRIGPRLP